MIDCENEILTRVSTALQSAFPGISVLSTTTFSPSTFPCVCFEEADNTAYRRSRDTASNENHAEVMYEVNVYSNKTSGAKAQCKSIFTVIDGIMDGLNFTRTAKMPVSVDVPMTYRLVGRYKAIISQNQTIYRR